MLLGIDIGTTNSKAGLFDLNGKPIKIASRPTIVHQTDQGVSYYDPEEMWATVASAVAEVMAGQEGKPVAAVGITSMAESGLLVDRKTGRPLSLFMPWFDTCSKPQADRIAANSDLYERFTLSGLHLSFKHGLPKLLWIKDHYPEALTKDACWLSASGYIAYRLSGVMGFDYSLAARTYAFRIDRKEWDGDFLGQFGLDAGIFPEATPSGTILGGVTEEAALRTGLPKGTPVAIAGHDHVAAALAVGAITPGIVYDSMGTAETLVGTLKDQPLGRKEYESGLSFGVHVAKGRFFWMGGNSSSGGSVEWLRSQFGEEPMPYDRMLQLLNETKPGPTGILYFPYLSGSGAPNPDTKAKAAFIGLSKSDGQGEMMKAVLEGTAYQLESIRRSAEEIAGSRIERLQVVGGGTRNPVWLQVKADVSRFTLELPPIPEATLLGAALTAAVGSGTFATAEEAAAAVDKTGTKIIEPDEERHKEYARLYNEGFVPLQRPLREFYRYR